MPGPFETSKDSGGATPDDGQTFTEDGPTTDETSQGSEVTGEDQSAGAKPYPEPQSAEGAFVNDEGVDLNTEADHGPNAQGNKYPFGEDAAANYRDEADARIKELEREIDTLKTQRDQWDAIAQGKEPEDVGGSESHTVKDEG